jgi:hypothetical protein
MSSTPKTANAAAAPNLMTRSGMLVGAVLAKT